MAYKEKLTNQCDGGGRPRRRTCSKEATFGVFDCWSRREGQYCEDHADAAVKRTEKRETAAMPEECIGG